MQAKTNKIRLFVFTTFFGVLWGLIEMFLGTYLHMVHLPFCGAVMASIGAIILCAERVYTPVRGATLYTGLTALIIKLLSIGAFKMGPVLGIFIETAVVELVFSVFGLSLITAGVACMLATLEVIPHFFIGNWLTYGSGIFDVYLQIVKQVQKIFGLHGDFWLQIISIWLGAHLIVGLAAAAGGIYIVKYLKTR